MTVELAELSAVLWRERELLQVLLFKLEEEQLLLAAGRTRWLPQATREVEVVLAEVSRVELHRAVESQHVAAALGLQPEASLSELAAVVPDPWGELLDQHRKAFVELTSEVSLVAKTNRELLRQGYESVSHSLKTVMGVETDGYGANGRPRSTNGPRRLLNGVV